MTEKGVRITTTKPTGTYSGGDFYVYGLDTGGERIIIENEMTNPCLEIYEELKKKNHCTQDRPEQPQRIDLNYNPVIVANLLEGAKSAVRDAVKEMQDAIDKGGYEARHGVVIADRLRNLHKLMLTYEKFVRESTDERLNVAYLEAFDCFRQEAMEYAPNVWEESQKLSQPRNAPPSPVNWKLVNKDMLEAVRKVQKKQDTYKATLNMGNEEAQASASDELTEALNSLRILLDDVETLQKKYPDYTDTIVATFASAKKVLHAAVHEYSESIVDTVVAEEAGKRAYDTTETDGLYFRFCRYMDDLANCVDAARKAYLNNEPEQDGLLEDVERRLDAANRFLAKECDGLEEQDNDFKEKLDDFRKIEQKAKGLLLSNSVTSIDYSEFDPTLARRDHPANHMKNPEVIETCRPVVGELSISEKEDSRKPEFSEHMFAYVIYDRHLKLGSMDYCKTRFLCVEIDRGETISEETVDSHQGQFCKAKLPIAVIVTRGPVEFEEPQDGHDPEECYTVYEVSNLLEVRPL